MVFIIFNILYVTSLGLLYLLTGSSHLLTTFIQFPFPLLLSNQPIFLTWEIIRFSGYSVGLEECQCCSCHICLDGDLSPHEVVIFFQNQVMGPPLTSFSSFLALCLCLVNLRSLWSLWCRIFGDSVTRCGIAKLLRRKGPGFAIKEAQV